MTPSRSNAAALLVVILIIGGALGASSVIPAADVTYHALKSTRELLLTQWTHVEVPGVVVAVRDEADGDLHVVLGITARATCAPADFASGDCVVAELRPRDRPLNPTPKPGDHVRVDGVSRYDREHKWAEVHPVDQLLILATTDAPMLAALGWTTAGPLYTLGPVRTVFVLEGSSDSMELRREGRSINLEPARLFELLRRFAGRDQAERDPFEELHQLRRRVEALEAR